MATNFIIATAGHVDHGKSALVKALTGTDPDRLPEEKARGITIDLGFAHLELETQNSKLETQKFHLGLIDVPGHEDFVKNMVAGVGSIDLALFVVAADDGWMPQTEEHLQILTYLGVTRAVFALTKMDLVESDEEAVINRLRQRLEGTPFARDPIVPTSVLSGRGLDALKTALARMLIDTPAPRDIGKPRMPIDRVFILRGIGTVVTGTLTGGVLRRGQSVVLQPAGQSTRIRSLQNHNRDVELAGPGTRTAVNLPDVSAEAVQRGQVLTLAELGSPSSTADVLLEKSLRLLQAKSSAARPLKDGSLVRVHHGSGSFPARVVLLGLAALGPGQQALAQLRFESPVFLFLGDRFIIRDWSEENTLAGGLVLDVAALPKQCRSAARQIFLKERSAAVGTARALGRSLLARDGIAPRASLLLQSRFSSSDVSEAVGQWVAAKEAILAADFVADASWWNNLILLAAGLIQGAHREHPEKLGLPLNELRQALEPHRLAPGLFEALLADLGRQGFVQVGTAIRAATHRPALPPRLQAVGAKLRAGLAAKPFEVPPRNELTPDSTATQALRFLLETGEAVELGDDLVMLAENFARAAEAIKKHIRERGPATVSDLRQMLGTNRRVIVPLLERLDREGVTLRQGDKRVLRAPGPSKK
jgi:selenocysteine-specific elongation factor